MTTNDAHHHQHHLRAHLHRPGEFPLVVAGCYAVGYLTGKLVAVLWTRGPAEQQGVRRLAGGVAHRPVPAQRDDERRAA